MAIIPPNDAPYLGSFMRSLFRKRLGEPYRSVLESLDSIDGDLNRECTTYLGDVLELFGIEKSGAFFEAELRALQNEESMMLSASTRCSKKSTS